MSNKKPFERYEDYVHELEKQGQKFPVNQFGGINLQKIQEAAGVRRQWFSENSKKIFGKEKKTLEAIIQADIKRIGTEIAPPRDPDEELSKIADHNSREASQLRQMLEQKSKENEQLRTDVVKLREEVRVLKSRISEAESNREEILDSGRCFFL